MLSCYAILYISQHVSEPVNLTCVIEETIMVVQFLFRSLKVGHFLGASRCLAIFFDEITLFCSLVFLSC